MEFTTSDLLKNASFSSKQYHRFDHYMTLLNLCKGVVTANIDVDSIKQLEEKLNMHVDSLTDYITNIFDFDLYIKDGKPDIIYVVNVADKSIAGTIAVDFFKESLVLNVNQTSTPPLSSSPTTIKIVKE
ncbi:ac26-like protein [Alphabaculovirus altersperidaniae]|uniref:Ac26-like protein n=1 Tax=Spodoptera eridania nucleopolyhedrovirus TaxID=2315721 RepID=A0ABX6TRD8_9ABAC|nr:ac26-like protein [Spodoptera eridania nucleopolyhedrovirus]QNV47907.1 ac26-like protein [Spodoptera eridania nucleopolyhedrovirus]